MKKSVLFTALIVSFVLAGCALFKVTYNTVYQKYNSATLVDTLTVSKGGVSITVSNLDLDEYSQPEYSIKYPVVWGGSKYTSTRSTVINLFYHMTAYNVEITNNTNNVLSLANARIALIIPDASEPVFALNKSALVESKRLPCILFEQAQINRAYSEVDELLALTYIWSAVVDLINGKSIVSRTTEVLPGMKVKGLIVFPYDSEKIVNGTVSFIDVTSNTDEAGNTTLKTRFDYKIAQERVFVKREYSQEQRKYLPFVRISEEEYNAAQQPKKN
jgi:hypothetical protein